jgi:hypothetical protein
MVIDVVSSSMKVISGSLAQQLPPALKFHAQFWIHCWSLQVIWANAQISVSERTSRFPSSQLETWSMTQGSRSNPFSLLTAIWHALGTPSLYASLYNQIRGVHLNSERESHASDLYRLIIVGSFIGPVRIRPFRRRWFHNTGKLLSWVWPCDAFDDWFWGYDGISLFCSSIFQRWTTLANNHYTGKLSNETPVQDDFIYWWARRLFAWFGPWRIIPSACQQMARPQEHFHVTQLASPWFSFSQACCNVVTFLSSLWYCITNYKKMFLWSEFGPLDELLFGSYSNNGWLSLYRILPQILSMSSQDRNPAIPPPGKIKSSRLSKLIKLASCDGESDHRLV